MTCARASHQSRSRARLRRVVGACAGAVLPLLSGATARAQSGDGSTTGAVVALPAGSRAAAMGGAYAAGRDIDVLFYNPAGATSLRKAAALSYERHIEDIAYGSLAALYAAGAMRFALIVNYVDFGSIDVIAPDPAFNGQRGMATGETTDAGEGIARLAVALPLWDDRASIGVAAGVLYSTLAESGRGTFVADAGVQYRVRRSLHAGLVLRNLSSGLDGARLAPASLPTELRLGLAHSGIERLLADASARLHADLVANIETGGIAAAAGIELSAPITGDAAAALRAGYDGTNGPHGLGRWHAGAGLTLNGIAVDYALQHMDALGTIHRFGIRWSR